MTYPEFQRAVLQLINLYSIHGTALPSSYHDVGDYAVRIPALLNSALTEIAAVTLAYVTEVPVSELEELTAAAGGACRRYALPEDLLSERGACVISGSRDCMGVESADIRTSGSGGTRVLQVKRRTAAGDAWLCYRRLPAQVDTTPGASLTDVTLDGSPEVLQAATYFAAALLVLQDDAFAYSALRNEYSEKLERLLPRTASSAVCVCDVYGIL